MDAAGVVRELTLIELRISDQCGAMVARWVVVAGRHLEGHAVRWANVASSVGVQVIEPGSLTGVLAFPLGRAPVGPGWSVWWVVSVVAPGWAPRLGLCCPGVGSVAGTGMDRRLNGEGLRTCVVQRWPVVVNLGAHERPGEC